MKRGRKPKPSSNWHHKDGNNPPGYKKHPKWNKHGLTKIKCKERGEPHDWEFREDASTFEVERFRCKTCGWWGRRYTCTDRRTPVPYDLRVPRGSKTKQVMDTVAKPDETWSKSDLLHYRRNAKIL